MTSLVLTLSLALYTDTLPENSVERLADTEMQVAWEQIAVRKSFQKLGKIKKKVQLSLANINCNIANYLNF